MKTTIRTILAAAFVSLALVALGAFAAAPPGLASPEAIRQLPLAGSLERTPATFVRPFQEGEEILPPAPHVAQSREFWRTVTASQLQGGVEFTTTAPGAVVRLSPLRQGAAQAPLDPALLEVRTANGDTFAAGSAFDTVATADQLRRAGVPFPEGTTAFRLRPEAGFGRLRLSAPGLGEPADAAYLLHVLDAGSRVTLSLRAASDTVPFGGTLAAQGWLSDAGEFQKVSLAEAEVAAPDSRRWPAKVQRQPDGSLAISLVLDAPPSPEAGLWELHLRVRGEVEGLGVEREVHTAFAYVLPTVRLSGPAVAAGRRGTVKVTVPVEAAAEGRYAFRALVTGRDGRGEPRPMAWVESAGWMEAGAGRLSAEVPAGLVRASGLRPPYEVREVSLLDQSRLQVLPAASG
jgi:hypothetical protein